MSATCPMCRKNPKSKVGKTCGDSACRAALSAETRRANIDQAEWERRQQIYGRSNEWVRWESEQRNR